MTQVLEIIAVSLVQSHYLSRFTQEVRLVFLSTQDHRGTLWVMGYFDLLSLESASLTYQAVKRESPL